MIRPMVATKSQTKFRTEPVFGVSDRIMPDMEYARIGGKMKVIIDYEVIEKTKSYTVMRINYVHKVPKRII